MSGMLVSGETFSITKVLSDDVDDFQDPTYTTRRRNLLTCTWFCRGLDGSKCSESFPERTCDFEPPEHVPRTSARAQTCVRGPGGLPACHGAESTRKDPRPGDKQTPTGHKNTCIYLYIHSIAGVAIRCFFFTSNQCT